MGKIQVIKSLAASQLTYNHCHIVGTQTPYSSRPPTPTCSMLLTNHKSVLARTSDKLCFPTLNGGKGVCGPTTYDTDYLYVII